MKNFWLTVQELKNCSLCDIEAARELERLTGLSVCEWIELDYWIPIKHKTYEVIELP